MHTQMITMKNTTFNFISRPRRWSFFLFTALFLLTGCKKDKVDASTTRTLQSSINDMASGLSTLQQVKFNEALYILKTFAVEAESDESELMALGTLINNKKVPDIFALADQVAQKNDIEWKSTGPPSLGEMNIFGNVLATESDPNDIKAQGLDIEVTERTGNEVIGVQALQVIPRLVNNSNDPIAFSGAGLEAILEVFSGGNRILTAKNLMQDNRFKGFNVRYASLPAQKIIDQKIDITVSIKTTNKTFKMTKVGISVNPKALLMPAGDPAENPANATESPTDEQAANSEVANSQTALPAIGDPKSSVSKFLNNLAAQNLRAAYDVSDNPSWGSFDKFSNPTSGFGGVKNINIKNISTINSSPNVASVNATYDIVDKEGRTTAIQVTFGMKNVNGEWKIASYKIN